MDDELDGFWRQHFSRPASNIERRLISAFERTVGETDPLFPILMMLVFILYETLGSTEKAVLAHGPVLERRLELLQMQIASFSQMTASSEKVLQELSSVSQRLLATYDVLSARREAELRLAVMPDWIKISITAIGTTMVMAAGAVLYAMVR